MSRNKHQSKYNELRNLAQKAQEILDTIPIEEQTGFGFMLLSMFPTGLKKEVAYSGVLAGIPEFVGHSEMEAMAKFPPNAQYMKRVREGAIAMGAIMEKKQEEDRQAKDN